MKRLFLALLLCGLWASVAEAKPLLIRWDPYIQGTVPAERLVLWRKTNKGTLQPYAVIADMAATSFVDNAVQWNKTYCYRLRAVTATDVPSAYSGQACARPIK